MTELEKIKREIVNYCKNKFDIFYCESPPSDENIAVWESDNYEDFLKFAEKFGVKVVYLSAMKIEEEDVKNQEHVGEVSQVIVGFFLNGIYHAFIKTADWFIPPSEEELEEEEEIPKEIVEKSTEKLAEEMIEFIKKEYPEAMEEESFIDDAQTSFWESKGFEPGFGLDPKIRVKTEKVERIVEGKILEQITKKEKEILPSLVKECVAWANEQGLNKLIKTNIDYFLTEKGITLSRKGKDVLYTKANFELKKK